jgi:hypothetical protein
MEECFKSKYLLGKVDFEELDDYIHDWSVHDEEPGSLREFMGINAEEEDIWIEEGEDALKEMLDEQKK